MTFIRTYLFPALVMFLLDNCLQAQEIPDSLLHRLNNAANDSVKTSVLLDIGETIESTLTQKSFNYYQQALVLSDSLFTTETSEKVADVEASYQNEKKLI